MVFVLGIDPADDNIRLSGVANQRRELLPEHLPQRFDV